jgi:hypothetical protein
MVESWCTIMALWIFDAMILWFALGLGWILKKQVGETCLFQSYLCVFQPLPRLVASSQSINWLYAYPYLASTWYYQPYKFVLEWTCVEPVTGLLWAFSYYIGGNLWVKIWCTWAQVILFFKIFENHISECLKIWKQKFGCSQLFIPQTWKKSCSNTLYFGLHKKDKSLDLSTYIFKSTNFLRFVIFV